MSDEIQKAWNRFVSIRIVGNGSKPATTEPPVWKDDTKEAWIRSFMYFSGKQWGEECSREFAEAEWQRVCVPPDPTPLSQALEAFIARRVKKREDARPGATEILHNALRRSVRVVAKGQRVDEPVDPRSDALSRAFASPLTFTARLGMKHP